MTLAFHLQLEYLQPLLALSLGRGLSAGELHESMPSLHLDILWLLIAASLVMLMQLGFCMLESGLVRTKNTINVAVKNLVDFCLASLLFFAVGYAFMFGRSEGGIIGLSGFFLDGVTDPMPLAYFFFQLVFCCTAATIISGAVAERMSFRGYIILSALVSVFFYPVAGHWIWSSEGWLSGMGFIDFAGSTVVHSVGGWLALAAVMVIGPRLGRFDSDNPLASPHSLIIATFGVLILFFGWLGFNGGSTAELNSAVPGIIVNTVIAGTAGGMGGMLISWVFQRMPSLGDILNGTIAGLVAITACCHVVTPMTSLVIGAIGAIICFFATRLLTQLKIDDVVGAAPAHAFPGVWGTLAVALLGNPEAWGTGFSRWEQFFVQLLGVSVIFVWAFGLGYVVLLLINRLKPLRVSQEAEEQGLNIAEHGASTEIYDLLTEMSRHQQEGDFDSTLEFQPHSEVGQIAAQYNRVIARVNEEMNARETIADELRDERQKVSDHNRNMVASIQYAQKIQNAVLPDERRMEEVLGEQHFVFFRPKDIVSGDFYWCQRTDAGLFVAVVDCTGHGVPGAFMSLIGHNLLNQIVIEQGITDPGRILAELNQAVREALRQTAEGSESADGMDVCLCRILDSEVLYAGAKRPLYVLRPAATGYSLEEIKGDRQAIGGRQRVDNPVFHTHSIETTPEMLLYLSSDGFVDQPDERRRPFDSGRFKRLLMEIAPKQMKAQNELLAEELDNFRGEAPARDDITVLGLRLGK